MNAGAQNPIPPATAAVPPRRPPRYTSYPTALEFTDGFGPDDLLDAIARSNEPPLPADLAVYLHMPYCRELCWYCGCNKVVTRHEAPIARYLETLQVEIASLLARVDDDRPVRLLQIGGGTPNVMHLHQIAGLLDAIAAAQPLAPDLDAGIEIDPRICTPEYLHGLRELGFTRISFGVQDLDPAVQQAIHRVQSAERILVLIAAAREAGFASINCDLVCGLPAQSPESLRHTIGVLADAGVDRFALFEYAHNPGMFRAQRLLERVGVPQRAATDAMFRAARQAFADRGFVRIGMDHFARPGDPLLAARAQGSLRRGFQGYYTGAGLDLIGFGASAISEIGEALVQNAREVRDWSARIGEGGCATARGVRKTPEDLVRGAFIESLMCMGSAELNAAMQQFGAIALPAWREALARLAADAAIRSLIRIQAGRITVGDAGMDRIREIARAFDAYRR